MTIALVIKVNDGVVLAADSATTMGSVGPDGSLQVMNIYNNANKVFNLHKGLPIGAMTWGLGNVGPASIATLAKDVRRAFHGESSKRPEWRIDPSDYTIEHVADRVRDFLWDKYVPVHGAEPATPEEQGRVLGFLTAGYSCDSDDPHVFTVSLGEDGGDQVTEHLVDDTGAMWWGQPEAIARIVGGMSLDALPAMVNVGISPDEVVPFYNAVRAQVAPQMIPPAMPIQDAIDLAEFLVYATIQFVRFCPGNPTVGGPIEIATITKHEGFKWVKRKHYFDTRLNPPQEVR
ncbi:hypothetical protein ACQP60_08635 [Isoptericola variabilis]|uniref:hypothetical protein n=1 Tax=Isoptericola variabilis TaxID=139208 RepID=UPI003D1A181E